MISFKHRGNFKKTDKLLTGALKINVLNILHKYAKQGIIALSTATPKSAINPTPAEMLKGIPRIHRNSTPPTIDSGIAEKIIVVTFNELNAKFSNKKTSGNAIGTMIIKRLDAFFRFSYCPP